MIYSPVQSVIPAMPLRARDNAYSGLIVSSRFKTYSLYYILKVALGSGITYVGLCPGDPAEVQVLLSSLWAVTTTLTLTFVYSAVLKFRVKFLKDLASVAADHAMTALAAL